MTGETLYPHDFYENFEYEVMPEDVERVEVIDEFIEDSIERNLIPDPVELACLQGIRHAFVSAREPAEEGFSYLMASLFAAARNERRYLPDGYALRKMEVALDYEARSLTNHRGEQMFTESEYLQWGKTKGFWAHYVFPNMNERRFRWAFNQNLRSSPTDSHIGAKALIELHRGRYPDGAVIVDVGVGVGTATAKLKMHKQFPYQPPEVYQRPRRAGEPYSQHLPPDEIGQRAISNLVTREPSIGPIYGLDIMPVQRYEYPLAYSSTFPMGLAEKDPAAVVEYNQLREAEHPDVHILNRTPIDATDKEALESLAEILKDHGGIADVFLFSGLILQLSPESLHTFFENYRPFCSPGALFVVNEWANINPLAPGGLEIIKEDYWHKGQFKTFYKAAFSEGPWIEFARYLSRQCRQMILSKAGVEMVEEHSK